MFTTIGRLFRKRKVKKLNIVVKNCVFPNPAHVELAGKTKKTGGPADVASIPLSQVESLLGIHWVENILVSPKDHLIQAQYHVQHDIELSFAEIVARLNNLYENLIIRWLNDSLGWVVTLKPGGVLRKGFVCCYAGVMTKYDAEQASSYTAREYFFSLLKTEKSEIGVEAKTYGNIARFFPFLLEKKYVDNFNFDSAVKERIAIANLQFKIMTLDGVNIPCVYAPEDLFAPSDRELLLGVHYSLPYLYKMLQPKGNFCFLDKKTFYPIGSQYYSQKFIQVELIGLSCSFNLPRIRIMIAENLPHLEHRMVGFDQVKNEYYEIIIADIDIYHALMQQPDATSVAVAPRIIPISYIDYMQKKNK